jgi:metal-responsive CopG/Arc/MetJ family transcriptional regulator
MATKHLSATVNVDILNQFDQAITLQGIKRSHAVEEAIKLYLKACDEALIAEGCRASNFEDLAFAKAGKSKALKAISRNL